MWSSSQMKPSMLWNKVQNYHFQYGGTSEDTKDAITQWNEEPDILEKAH